MKYRFTLIAAVLLAFAGSHAAQRGIDTPIKPVASPRWHCERIVSMAPSLTEILYALGLGDRVVGVSRDCHYPPEVEQVQKTGNVGGYYDPNLEAIVALKPDLVVMLEEQAAAMPNFEKLRIETLAVNQQTIEGVIESVRVIGGKCGRGPEGRWMARDLQERVDRIRRQTRSLSRPRVLFALDRTFGCGHLADLYVAADDNYIDTMIDWAGGKNAYSRRGARYPIVSTEGILSLNPDVIIDLVPGETVRRLGRRKLLEDWSDANGVAAVKNGRVMIFDQDYASVPGPRFIRLVEDLARRLHPEVDWNHAQPEH